MQQMYLPPLTKINKVLLIVLVSSFVISTILSQALGLPVNGILGLSTNAFFSGYIWQLLTYPLINTGLMEVVFTGLLLWFIGSELESLWGTKKYITYLLMTTLFSAIAFLVITLFVGSSFFSGMGFLSSAMCVSYAVIYPDRIFQFFMVIPVKAKYFCLILAAMSLYQGLVSSGKGAALGQLSAMAFGYIFLHILKMSWFKKLVANKAVKSPFQAKKSATKNSHLRIVKEDDNEKPPRYWQ